MKARDKNSTSRELKVSNNIKSKILKKGEEDEVAESKISRKFVGSKQPMAIYKEKDRIKTGNSYEKTKDQTKKVEETKRHEVGKGKSSRKVIEEYTNNGHSI